MRNRTAKKLLIAIALTCVAIEPAFAQAAGVNVEGVLQNIVDLLTGNVARLLAVIAVVIAGIATMFGRLDLQKFGVLVVGMMLVFGGAQIVGMITGS